MAGDVTLYDAVTGAPIQADATTAGELVRAGKAGFKTDQTVDIVDQAGQLQKMSGADAAAYLGSAEAKFGGGGVATATAVRHQQLEQQYGGLGGGALAALAGAGRGATLGLSDLALTKAGLVDASTLKGLEEVNPGASLLGEGAGILAPVLLSGGGAGAGVGALKGAGGGLARGAVAAAELAPSALAGTLGRGVERALLGGAAEGAGWAARAGASAVGAGAEGALFGVGSAISRASIDDHALTGEKLVAAAGMGALLGGAAGGGLSAAGSLLRGGVDKAAGALARTIDAGEGRLAGELTAATPKTAGGAQALAGQVERDLALKGAGADARALAEIRAAGGDLEARAVRMAQEDLARVAGKAEGTLLAPAEKAAAARRLADESAAKVEQLAGELTKAGEKVDVAGAMAAHREELAKIGAEAVNPKALRAVKEAEDLATRIEHLAGDGDPAKLLKIQRELRREIDHTLPAGESLSNDLHRNLSKALDGELVKAGTAAEAKLGPEWAARWANAGGEARAADWLAAATAQGAKASAKAGSFGALEAGKAALGALTGGGGLTGAALAVPSAYLGHVVKQHGAELGAQLARAASRGELVAQIGRHLDQVLGARVGALVGTGRGVLSGLRPTAPLAALAAAPRSKDSPLVAFKTQTRELAAFRAAPGPRLAAATAGLEGARPEVRQAVAATVQRGADFLASKMPRRPPPPAGLPAHLQRDTPVSPSEAATWLRYARAVNDPLSVLEDARKGLLSREAIEAVKAVYPSVYRALQGQVSEALQERQKPLAWKEKLQLSTLLGLPTDPNLEPDAIRLYQSVQTAAPSPTPDRTAAAGGKGPQPSPPKRPMTAPKLATKGDLLAA